MFIGLCQFQSPDEAGRVLRPNPIKIGGGIDREVSIP